MKLEEGRLEPWADGYYIHKPNKFENMVSIVDVGLMTGVDRKAVLTANRAIRKMINSVKGEKK